MTHAPSRAQIPTTQNSALNSNCTYTGHQNNYSCSTPQHVIVVRKWTNQLCIFRISAHRLHPQSSPTNQKYSYGGRWGLPTGPRRAGVFGRRRAAVGCGPARSWRCVGCHCRRRRSLRRRGGAAVVDGRRRRVAHRVALLHPVLLRLLVVVLVPLGLHLRVC